jgi:hypothetical protein
MAENETRGYRESENFVPSPYDQVGSARTDGNGGADVRTISPVFNNAYKASLKLAARALDPEDSTPASHVVLPTGATVVHSDPEAAQNRILAAASALDDSDPALKNHPAPETANYAAGFENRETEERKDSGVDSDTHSENLKGTFEVNQKSNSDDSDSGQVVPPAP